jgi:hypothetical protein
MTRKEILIAGALTALLTLITLAVLAWGNLAGAQALMDAPIVAVVTDVWVLRIRELGGVVTPIVATIASTIVLLWKLKQTHVLVNSQMEEFKDLLRSVGAAKVREAEGRARTQKDKA